MKDVVGLYRNTQTRGAFWFLLASAVRAEIQRVDPSLPVRAVRATRGKRPHRERRFVAHLVVVHVGQ